MSAEYEPTKAEIAAEKQRIEIDTVLAVKVLRAIYSRQTAEEQFKQEWNRVHDKRGFQPHETRAMCRLYERLEERGFAVYPSEANRLRAEMPKYARQFLVHEHERKQAEIERHRAHRAKITPEMRAAARAEQAERERKRREENPLRGAALRDPSILDRLPEL